MSEADAIKSLNVAIEAIKSEDFEKVFFNLIKFKVNQKIGTQIFGQEHPYQRALKSHLSQVLSLKETFRGRYSI